METKYLLAACYLSSKIMKVTDNISTRVQTKPKICIDLTHSKI